MTEYTRQMHDKIMKIYRRENAKLNLWLLTGFLPPILTLFFLFPLRNRIYSLFPNENGNFIMLGTIFTLISTFVISVPASLVLFGISNIRAKKEIQEILCGDGTGKGNFSLIVKGSFLGSSETVNMISDTIDDIKKNVASDMQDEVLYMSLKKYFEEDVPAMEKELNEKRTKRIEKLKKRKQLLIERGNKNEASLHKGEARGIPENTGQDQDK
jgi:hypothetical protein